MISRIHKTHTIITNKYKEDFLAHVCDAVEQDLAPSELNLSQASNQNPDRKLKQNRQQKKKNIGYFLKRLDTLEEKAQAKGLSEEVLFEILSYDPDSDNPDNEKEDLE